MSDVNPGEAESRDVVPVELLFDLVFVFALSQLSRHLVDHLSWRGAAQTAVLLCAVFGVWAYTSFQATVLGPDRSHAQRALIVVLFLSLIMNAAIGGAFAASPWTFVAPLLASQFGYAALTLRIARDSGFTEHYRRVLVWFTITAPLWLVGATADPTPRLAWWAAAALVDVTGTWLAHPLPRRVLHSTDLPFDASHMVERLRLFLIIALGEAVVTTGTAIAAKPSNLPTIAAGIGGLGAVVALWAVYFGGTNRQVSEHLDQTSDPIRSARLGINAMYVALAGLVGLAAGNELVIAHPTRHGSWTLSLLLFGGPLLYLAAQNWYLAAIDHTLSRWVWFGCAALIAGGLAARFLPRWASLSLLLAVLLAVVAGAVRARRRAVLSCLPGEQHRGKRRQDVVGTPKARAC